MEGDILCIRKHKLARFKMTHIILFNISSCSKFCQNHQSFAPLEKFLRLVSLRNLALISFPLV